MVLAMSKWNNIDCNDFDEDSQKYVVTAYKTDDPDEKGTVIAKIDLADKSVEYIDETAKTDDYAKKVISEMLKNGYVLTE